MSFIREHALERFWLERRLSLLNLLDSLAEEHYYAECEEDSPKENSHKMMLIRNHYRDVLDPANVADTIKKIYPAKNYGKVKNV